jgi:methyltransferase-like protein/SAM-dependent methyltransferase
VTGYDQAPYPSLSYSQSHPDRLATVATLLGMSPAAVERCRVLELGCAGGGNLIPMAYSLPGSDLVGVDYSARQIAEGQSAIAALGLTNIALKHLDILEVDADLGQFDYIIAHGVYSWVTPAVQDKILDICKQNLAPNGVAYVSYNTYPGWHMINIVRGIMLYHTRNVADPQERATQARAVLELLADAGLPEDSAYGSFIKMYAQFLSGKMEDARPRRDALLLHDELEEVNEPVHFHQFAAHAGRHGLQYVGDAEFQTMFIKPGSVPPRVLEAINDMTTSVVDLEQYIDFIANRTFRQTLLCHEGIAVSRTLKPERLAGLYAASHAKPVTAEPSQKGNLAEVLSRGVAQFRGSDGATLSIDHPVSKMAFLCLAEAWPRPVQFGDLLAQARTRAKSVSQQHPDDAQALGVNLLTAYSYSDKLLELHAYAPPLALEAGERPVASPVARFQAQDNERVTNLRHERVSVDEADRYLLRHLDGSRDRPALLDLLLSGPVAEGILTVQDGGKPVEDPNRLRKLLTEEMDGRLRWLARAGLLVGSPSRAGALHN